MRSGKIHYLNVLMSLSGAHGKHTCAHMHTHAHTHTQTHANTHELEVVLCNYTLIYIPDIHAVKNLQHFNR